MYRLLNLCVLHLKLTQQCRPTMLPYKLTLTLKLIFKNDKSVTATLNYTPANGSRATHFFKGAIKHGAARSLSHKDKRKK